MGQAFRALVLGIVLILGGCDSETAQLVDPSAPLAALSTDGASASPTDGVRIAPIRGTFEVTLVRTVPTGGFQIFPEMHDLSGSGRAAAAGFCELTMYTRFGTLLTTCGQPVYGGATLTNDASKVSLWFAGASEFCVSPDGNEITGHGVSTIYAAEGRMARWLDAEVHFTVSVTQSEPGRYSGTVTFGR